MKLTHRMTIVIFSIVFCAGFVAGSVALGQPFDRFFVPQAPMPSEGGFGGGGGIPRFDSFRALQFANFLQNTRGDEIVCQAIGGLFDAHPPAGCAGQIINERKTVFYRVTLNDAARQLYEIELVGKSIELSLKDPSWVERHRFYVALGFDGQLQPHITVVDFEAMFRTTSELLPIRDDLFGYIGREHDSLLRAFQDRIKGSISTAVQTAFDKQIACGSHC